MDITWLFILHCLYIGPQQPCHNEVVVYCNKINCKGSKFRHLKNHRIVIIIIITIFKEDKVFSMTVNLSYGPLVNTDNDYYRTIFFTYLKIM